MPQAHLGAGNSGGVSSPTQISAQPSTANVESAGDIQRDASENAAGNQAADVGQTRRPKMRLLRRAWETVRDPLRRVRRIFHHRRNQEFIAAADPAEGPRQSKSGGSLERTRDAQPESIVAGPSNVPTGTNQSINNAVSPSYPVGPGHTSELGSSNQPTVSNGSQNPPRSERGHTRHGISYSSTSGMFRILDRWMNDAVQSERNENPPSPPPSSSVSRASPPMGVSRPNSMFTATTTQSGGLHSENRDSHIPNGVEGIVIADTPRGHNAPTERAEDDNEQVQPHSERHADQNGFPDTDDQTESETATGSTARGPGRS
jgi:hypothetical protein